MKLEDFCATNDTRNYLQSTFEVAGHSIGSNGHWMAFIKGHNGDSAEIPENVRARISSIIKTSHELNYQSLPPLIEPEKVDCYVCKGIGRSQTVLCPECEGDGSVELENDYNTYYDIECKSCGGFGHKTTTDTDSGCLHCGNTGKAYSPAFAMDIDGVLLNPRYLIPVSKLPKVEVAALSDKNLLFFRSSELNGVIMGRAA